VNKVPIITQEMLVYKIKKEALQFSEKTLRSAKS